ncbi:hypothetical protein BC834DRAFT_609836 [Gloeopeniophorella convolvens]|nr:hypothetical protein BC834DRAFT_609836 [Gloeopeniophorella convolvens]
MRMLRVRVLSTGTRLPCTAQALNGGLGCHLETIVALALLPEAKLRLAPFNGSGGLSTLVLSFGCSLTLPKHSSVLSMWGIRSHSLLVMALLNVCAILWRNLPELYHTSTGLAIKLTKSVINRLSHCCTVPKFKPPGSKCASPCGHRQRARLSAKRVAGARPGPPAQKVRR